MLSFLFLKYLSTNYEESAKKELGRDYPSDTPPDKMSKLRVKPPLEQWYKSKTRTTWWISKSKCAEKCIM
ncbi:MAG: hypothetical protein U5N56_05305 [Candidatus Marinimicrobia bacterium]|nr:hypothetical protein [Candidatus Neomarinimicrobiota bacterium]